MFNNRIFIVVLFLSVLVDLLRCQPVNSTKESMCFIKHAGHKYYEGDTLDMKGKFYKVEDCALHRAYNACGPHLIYILNLVCQAVEKQKYSSNKRRVSRFVQQKLLTEACCQNLCTVSEMSRYCPH